MKNNKNAKHADHFQQCVVKDVCGLSLSFFTCSHQESKALCSAPGPRRPWSECICWTDCRPGRRLQQNSITNHSPAHRREHNRVNACVCASQTCEVFAVVLFDPLRRLKLLFGMFLGHFVSQIHGVFLLPERIKHRLGTDAAAASQMHLKAQLNVHF